MSAGLPDDFEFRNTTAPSLRYIEEMFAECLRRWFSGYTEEGSVNDPRLDKSAAVGFVDDQSMSLRAIMLLAIMIRPFSGRRRVAV